MTTVTLTREAPAEVAETDAREFSFHDRCERCGFQAYFVAIRRRTEVTPGLATETEETQELVFCKHHGDKHTPGLAAAGWNVLDFTDKINEKPTDPSDDEV